MSNARSPRVPSSITVGMSVWLTTSSSPPAGPIPRIAPVIS